MGHRFDTPVPKDAISKRQQGGQNLSYLDSHYIISKANELLEHEKWSYTVDKYQLVQDEIKETEKNNVKKKNCYVGYVAQVTVQWGGISRCDVGFGQGIDADLGRAHESAIKEAATDALKRALRTFGQAFGLALYDKSGKHISAYDEVEYRKSLGLTKDDAKHLKATFGDKLPKVMESAWAEKVYDRESMMAFADSYHCQEAGA